MMTCLRCAVTLGVALLAACQPLGTSHEGSSGDMSAVEALGRGEAMAETLCASCHAIGHLGTSPHSDALAFRRFGWNYPIEALSESLAEESWGIQICLNGSLSPKILKPCWLILNLFRSRVQLEASHRAVGH